MAVDAARGRRRADPAAELAAHVRPPRPRTPGNPDGLLFHTAHRKIPAYIARTPLVGMPLGIAAVPLTARTPGTAR